MTKKVDSIKKEVKAKKVKKPFLQRLPILKQVQPELLYIDWTRIFGRCYFFIQFIIFALLSFWALVGALKGFNLLMLIYIIPLGFQLGMATGELLQDITFREFCKSYQSKLANGPRAQCASGAPGAGKTSSKLYECVHLAKLMWKKLKFSYWLAMRIDKTKLNKQQLENYNEIVESFEFYSKTKSEVPCLFSNIPVLVGKRKAHSLTKKHLMQQERLPLFSVMFNDEIGLQFPAKKGTSEDLQPLSFLARFIRHYFDGYWNFTEQEFSKAFVDVRRCTGSNRYYTRQDWKLKPRLLLGLIAFLKSIFMFDLNIWTIFKPGTKLFKKFEKKNLRSSKLGSPILTWLNKLKDNVGWRKYYYTELGNSEVDVSANEKSSSSYSKSGKEKSFYLPSSLNCNYYDRTFKKHYKAKNKEINDYSFNSLILTEEEINRMFA